MESKPCILVLSDTNTKPQSLIKLISKSDRIEEDSTGMLKCNWVLDSKYYTADVCLIGMDRDFSRSEDFNNGVEAIIMHVDTNKITGLEDLHSWEKINQDCDSEVKLLVANYCNEDTKITKDKAIEWCLKRGYEFIELYPTNQENAASDFEEKVGVERIIEALQSHTWSNLKMKSQHQRGTLVDSNIGTSTKVNLEKTVDLLDDNFDDFTELFSQLQTMRESLNSLPSNQRKQCAEQMVTAFWKAIGGDDGELSES